MAQKKLLFCVIFLPEYLVSIEKSCNFAVSKGTEIRPKAKSKPKTDTLPCGVMVAHRILVPFVRVRVFPRQLKRPYFKDVFLFPVILLSAEEETHPHNAQGYTIPLSLSRL